MDSWERAGEENRKQNEYVVSYIQEHFGLDPDDPVAATSEALKAYYRSICLKFGSDEDSFILPKV